jgi:hypothetical protein
MNKTFEEIESYYNDLANMEQEVREMIRFFLSQRLMDTSEDNKLYRDIALDTHDCIGLSSLQMPWVTSMWQHPTEGYITFDIDEGRSERDFDELSTEELMIIIKYVD